MNDINTDLVESTNPTVLKTVAVIAAAAAVSYGLKKAVGKALARRAESDNVTPIA